VESPLPGDRHGGFGERPGETDREQSRHRAPGRLNQRLGPATAWDARGSEEHGCISLAAPAEAERLAGYHRYQAAVLRELSGTVLEIGARAGAGANLGYFSAGQRFLGPEEASGGRCAENPVAQ
jgi:hypothetical protein